MGASPEAAIKALAPGLHTAADGLGGAVVARESQDGTGQALTRSKKDVLRAIRLFVQDANAVNLVPAYRQRPDQLKELLPQGLMHLTDASATDLPVRFKAFADALTAHKDDLGGPALGKTAAALLRELAAATAAKDADLKVSKETIGSIGGQWALACQLLWQQPALAEAYFNYGLLPRRQAGRPPALVGGPPRFGAERNPTVPTEPTSWRGVRGHGA